MTRLAVLLGMLSGAARLGADDAASPVFFAISVPDLEASVEWYRAHLDLEVRRLPGSSRAKVAILEGNGLMVEILEHSQAFELKTRIPETESRYLVHGLFKVGWFVEDLDATVARLRARGARFRGEVIDDHTNRVRTVLVLDNNDNILQLFERID